MSATPPFPDLGVSHALLLQGPAGPFMERFAQDLGSAGVAVTKVNFHAGDRLFFPPSSPHADVVDYMGNLEDWREFFRELVSGRGIDGIFVFGDLRPLHRVAIKEARARDLRVWAFEEGYLRPHWITLEEHGVNGNSRLPRDPDVYRRAQLPDAPEALEVDPSFGPIAWYSTLSALAFTHWNRAFGLYRHHRPLNAYKHSAWWVRSAARKKYFAHRERHALEHLTGELSGRYFFVPLQVHCDFQLHHSPYDDVLEFIHQVVDEFAHGPADLHLVFKHHPMDRAYREYGPTFRRLGAAHGLTDRLHYVHDIHLPTLLRHARGTITINSTVGLQSMHHGTPVITLGTAIYDMPGLTHQGSLASFLEEPSPLDRDLYQCMRRWLLHYNQVNGSFYKPLRGIDNATGMRWFRGSRNDHGSDTSMTTAKDGER